LGNTTITSAASRGIASDAEASRQQLQEGITQQKVGVMERKTEQGPDMSMYANLLQKAAAGQQGNKLGPGGRTLVSGGTGDWAQGFSQWQRGNDVGGGY
jgi:hypothetical protein